MRQTVLLTGASGAVGFESLKELLRREDKYQIRLLALNTRRERRIFKKYRNLAEIYWGDIRDKNCVRQAAHGVDAVIHTAAIIPPLADHKSELAWQVNVEGTRNVVAALREQNPAPRLVYTSSISVYGDRVDEPSIQVGDALRPSLGDEYAKTKIQAEKLIRNSNLKWTIFRLCGILTDRLKIQPLMFHMPLNTALEWCHAEDAGYALVAALNCDRLGERIFNLGGGARCRTKASDFLKRMFPLFGLDYSVVPQRAFATKNFHSGDYIDGDELENMLHFRRKTLDDYYAYVKGQISTSQRLLVRFIPRSLIKAYLRGMSEPLKAIRQNNVRLIERFFGSRRAFEALKNSAVTRK